MPDVSVAAERRRQLATTVGIAVGFAAVRAVMETAFVYTTTRGVSLRFALLWTLPSWLMLLPIATGAVALANRFSFERKSRVQSIVVHTVSGVAFGLIHLAAITPLRVLIFGHALNRHGLALEFIRVFRLLFYIDVLTYWAIVGMYLALYYSNLRASLAEARLAALRAQLNPHFLFNTLHAISTLALRGDQAAVTDTIGRLSGLLRAALDEQTEEIPLAREIEFMDDYVAIQQVRFTDRLCVEKLIAPDTMRALVPTMILQPIVENAIKHGLNAQRGVGRVNVNVGRQNGSLVIEVRDSGPGFRPETVRDGIGLANTRARLEQLYGLEHRFECGSAKGGGGTVRITIPYHEATASAHGPAH